MYLIYGKGKVGLAIAALCEHKNIPYEIRDDADFDLSYDSYEAIIPGPGIPPYHSIYTTGKVICELDFAYQFLPKDFQLIAVTGTDGKSTTSWILYSILEKEYFGKKSVYLSGNFDIPFSTTILDIVKKGEKRGIIVLEVSSFMAYAMKKISFDYSIFTNFKADHLNWHKTLQEYFDAKMNILARSKKCSFINQEVIDFSKDHGLEISLPKEIKIFSRINSPTIKGQSIKNYSDGERIVMSGRLKYLLGETHFSGGHNAMNILSVGLVCQSMKICSKRIKNYLRDIYGLPHRLEYIGEKEGIRFVEDSKSTSSQSLDAALGSYGSTKNLLLIVGGSDKGDTFRYLEEKFTHRVKALVAIGATKQAFIDIAIKQNIEYIATDDLDEGVTWLYGRGKKGDVLMLSPGCASFGLFKDYLDRANQFRYSIKKILN